MAASGVMCDSASSFSVCFTVKALLREEGYILLVSLTNQINFLLTYEPLIRAFGVQSLFSF